MTQLELFKRHHGHYLRSLQKATDNAPDLAV